jgi:hypothetical protein
MGFGLGQIGGLGRMGRPSLSEGVGGVLPSINAIFAKATSSLWLTASPASKLKTTSAATTNVSEAGDPVGYWAKSSGNLADVLQATADSRPQYGESFVQGDGSVDYLASASGGGGTGAFYFCASIMHRAGASAQRIFGDRNGNNGRLLQIASTTNRVQLVGGSGAALVTASPVTALTAGQDYLIEAWYDGTTLNVSIDGGAAAQNTVTLTAGSAGFGILATSDGAGPFGGRLYDFVWSQGYVPTSDERTALRSDLTSRRDDLNAASDTPRYYIDSVAGNDTNDGLYSAAAKATWADTDADYAIEAYDVIGLKKDGEWRERVTPGVDDTKIVAYGSGTNRPILRGDDVIANASFTKTGGRTNVYEVSLAVETDANASEWPAMWVDGTRLVWAADLTALDAAPGSFYHGAITDTTPITLYIHSTGSTDPTADGKVYEAAIRDTCADTYAISRATVQGVKASRAYASYGSITGGKYSVISDCEAIDGNTHAVFVREGSRVSGGRYGDCYNHTTSPTIFIAYDTNPVAGVTVEDAEFFQTTYLADCIGVYMHTGAGTFPYLNLARNTYDNIGQPISAANCTLLTSVDEVITNFLTGFKPLCNANFTRLNLSAAKSGGILGISGAAGITVVVDEATGVFNSTGNLRSVHDNTDFTLQNSHLTGMNQVLVGSGTGQRWTSRENVLVPNGRMFTIYDLPADVLSNGNLNSDYNSFGGATGVWKIAGVTVATTLAEWQNYSGQDLHSEA